MKSILIETDKLELIERINKLTHESMSLWGTMCVSQMMAHCTVSVKLAFGEISPELNESYLESGKKYKDRVLETEMFSKNLPTSKEFLVPDNKNFEENKIELIGYINDYSEEDVNGQRKEPHPFFGELTVKEWGILIWKHTNHHLIQFGV